MNNSPQEHNIHIACTCKDYGRLTELWDEFDQETREQRLVKYPMDSTEGYFKPQFDDFILWLKEKK